MIIDISFVLMHFLCKTRHKDSCAWPCLTWHCEPIKSAEYNQRETTIVSDWKPYLQQYTKIIKTPTLQTYFSYILSKLKCTRNQMTSDLYVLNWMSSYDVMLLMYQRRQQHFAEFKFVWFLDQGYARIHFYVQYCIEEL